MQPEKIDMWINNEAVASDSYFEVRDPGKLTDVVGRVAKGNPSHVDQAVQAAHHAFQDWKNKSVAERLDLLQEALKAYEALSNDLPPLLAREHGGMLWEAQADFSRGAILARKTLELVPSFLEPQVVEDAESWLSIEKVPIGVTAVMVPWNSPMVLTMEKLAPALALGNTVVVKPSPNAPIVLTLVLKAMASHLPPGVINVVHGEADVGEAMTQHPLVRKVAFTGGIATGKKVMMAAASTIKNITLELGGNDPAILLDDVDIYDAVPKLCKGIFTRAGQICFAVKRIYVPQSLYDKFFDAMCEVVDEYRVGHGLDERSTFGPLNNRRQFEFVQGLIERTRQTNAVVRVLGKKVDPETWENGYYMLPAVVRDIDPGAELVTCEQFGPVIPLIPYRTVDEAVQMANATEFGLGSSVWSADVERALAVARRLEAGGTFINSHSLASLGLDTPFGGVKQSGIGRERGEIGLAGYVEYHSIRYIK